jgi:hypothetical protein
MDLKKLIGPTIGIGLVAGSWLVLRPILKESLGSSVKADKAAFSKARELATGENGYFEPTETIDFLEYFGATDLPEITQENVHKVNGYFSGASFSTNSIDVLFNDQTVATTNRETVDRYVIAKETDLFHNETVRSAYKFASGSNDKLSSSEFTNLTRRLDIQGVKRPKRNFKAGYELGPLDQSSPDSREIYLTVNDSPVGSTTLGYIKAYNEDFINQD